jgi:hypothetical protein
MNRQKWIILAVALTMMGGSVGFLSYLRSHQRLGRPGVKTSPLPGSIRLEVLLPERVLEYRSEAAEVDKNTLDFLPPDTSFGHRYYTAPDGFSIAANGVLMGSDRTSLHKPQLCLPAQGWSIDDGASSEEKVRIQKPRPYDLPVMKLVAAGEIERNGKRVKQRGIFVYWFVADGEYTAQHWQRMWWMLRDMVCTGVLQRWAYISLFTVCDPGQEDATFERLKQFIAASVPEFQFTPQTGGPAPPQTALQR